MADAAAWRAALDRNTIMTTRRDGGDRELMVTTQ
jgi:hypothetical protein